MVNRMAATAKWLRSNLPLMLDATEVYQVEATAEREEQEIRIVIEFADRQKVELLIQDAS